MHFKMYFLSSFFVVFFFFFPLRFECSNRVITNRTKSNQRWMKLRTTVQISSAIQKKPPLKREDSFLKRFSTRQIPETQVSGNYRCHLFDRHFVVLNITVDIVRAEKSLNKPRWNTFLLTFYIDSI